ncbi:MAG: hypothetical protein P0S96_01765 [Simkaniaceae bacterium]|nr:hypothetical protein [Candidatus Sacchlamyda saccharinae]
MKIDPSKQIENSVALRIQESRDGKVRFSSKDPIIAAKKLCSKQELALFYGKAPTAEVTTWALAVAQAAVAAAAIVAAAVLKGVALNAEQPLAGQEDFSSLDVNSLLEKRKDAEVK